MSDAHLERVYGAQNSDEARAAYDDWADAYERDLCAMGYRLPAAFASVFAAHVPRDAGPILDAGCGGGIQAEPLALLGYGPLTGIDLSEGMLAVARAKGLYAELRQMALGGRLDFPDDHFAVSYACGCISPGHAPASSFEDLTRVTRPGGLVLFSLRADAGQDPAYPEAVAQLAASGRWREVFKTAPFQSMPYGEPEITHRVHVYEVI
ncbi:Ubiquinone biosynthesis O-methyltransferase [Roseivivax sp. THAF40]|uniref:class I SAM-dependent DNA methyltransferase n=1 Tax=unclassified Roseivivax TaxID=2639302 RepID=UPI00126932E0|nr:MULTISPECIES: class I SAM-dependent methyltransferase [unclassified Roseivivax]QFS82519.1 Ubiquinone biosynthesis O-methyltransferase [Roseivivax sp. THAF197b]QFT46288.1 Ubiquinone biosynthesis O-methyltransferase [Roseivivax sp. THAF40]